MIDLLPRRLTLRLAFACIFSIVVTMFSLLIYVLHRDEAQSLVQTEVRAQSLVDGIAAAISAPAIIHDFEKIDAQFVRLALDPEVLTLILTDQQGRSHAGVERSQPGGALSYIEDHTLSQDVIRAGSLITQGRIEIRKPVEIGLYPMWLHLHLALPDTSSRRAIVIRDSLLVAFLAAILGALSLYFLLRRPVKTMETAASFANNLHLHHGRTLNLSPSVAEVDNLVQALNTASTELARQHHVIEQGRKRDQIRVEILNMLACKAELPRILDRLRQVMSADFGVAFDEIQLAAGSPDETLLAKGYRIDPIRDATGRQIGHLASRGIESADLAQDGSPNLQYMLDLAATAIEQKRIDTELQMAASVYQSSSEAMFVTDERNRIVAVNPAFTRYTGYGAGDVLGKDPGILGSGRTEKSVYLAMWRALEVTGQWQGEIWNRRKNGEEFAEWLSITTVHNSDGTGFRRIALFSDITEKKHNDELIWHQANYDPLTLLPNRRLFLDRVGHELLRAQSRNIPIIVMHIDLDRFKEVNDAHGHANGDVLLQEAAHRLSSCIRDGDTLARLGGDEFALLLPSVTELMVAERIADSMLSTLSRNFDIGREQIFITASIGITRYPDDAGDAETLMTNAERSMYLAKNAGRNNFAWFTLDLQEGARARHQLTKDLRRAIGTGEFEVYYQPIVASVSGKIVKAEALVRWNHPCAGQVSPGTFIPIAEETGMIGEIGDWVFRQVVAHLKLWGFGDLLQVSINLSPRQFANTRISQDWIEYLAQVGIPATALVIELTEGSLLNGSDETANHLHRFRSAGFQIAIDDFGTGFSALSYLQRFAVDYLKIDRSFIHDLAADNQDRALADAIIVMAHKLGLQVVAEGVETHFQHEYLLSVGCDYIQGYLFGRPMPVKDFAALLVDQQACHQKEPEQGSSSLIGPQVLH